MARNSIILNGKSSDTITGLLIQELPPISKPLMRSQVEEIDGRDGDIITKLGFSAYDKEISVGLYGNFDINEIIAYFNSEGTVTFSNEPDKFYYYQILDQIDFERLVRFRTATINFHVQPFKYSTTEEAETIEAGTVSGEGNNLVLENTSDAPFSKLTPKGDTFQQTSPGNNMLDRAACAENYSLTWAQGSNYSQTGSLASDYIAVAIGEQIKMTFKAQIMFYNENKTYLGCLQNNATTIAKVTGKVTDTFTVPNADGIYYMRLGFRSGDNSGADMTTQDIMVNKGDTLLPYEPYTNGPTPNPDYPQDIQVVTGEQTVKVVGKNLFNYTDTSGAIGSNNAVLTSLSNGVRCAYVGSTTSTASRYSYVIFSKADNYIGKTLTLTCDITPSTGTNGGYSIGYCDDLAGTNRARISDQVTTSGTPAIAQITSDMAGKYLYVLFFAGISNIPSNAYADYTNTQLELGSATAFEPYQSQSYPISLGSTELAKIGTYQDYIWKDGDTWKLHKEILKNTVSIGSTTTISGLAGGVSYAQGKRTGQNGALSTNAAYRVRSTETLFPGAFYENDSNFVFLGTSEDTKATLQNKYNGSPLYYVLATPTDTAISDETLIGQLEALNAAHAYKGRTHIVSTAGSDANLPHIIEAKVLGSSDTTITNAGNFISKPKFTIYGSGNIGLYINGIQILQIALGDEQYITIDAAQMEAYKDTLDNLKNRLVTGDYTNLALNPGENQISFSGSVEKYIVENYSRWL